MTATAVRRATAPPQALFKPPSCAMQQVSLPHLLLTQCRPAKPLLAPLLPAQAHLFADLPPDVLHRIFRVLLPSSQPLPLLDAAQQWQAMQPVQLTCKA